MYIIQMADLHIGSAKKTQPTEKEFLEKSVELIKERIPENSVILLCLCGDIIDSKNLKPWDNAAQKRYEEAADLMNQYIHSLEETYTISVGCCPGNHDITHVNKLLEFIKKIKGVVMSEEQLKSCYVQSVEDSYFLFVNSCDEDQYEVGRIDYNALESELKKLPRADGKVLILHHTIMSMYDDDSSSIRNAAKLINIADKYGITAILHGHIHGREILKLGERRCKVIGTGALFSRNNTNINSQFNIIQCNYGEITKVSNCRFNADGGNNPWNVQDLIEGDSENIFEGGSFKEVYNQLISKLQLATPLYNVILRIKADYNIFRDNLDEFLKDDYLKIGEKKYDYFELAEKWEEDEIPDDLYFNHGFYFKVQNTSGIDFVRGELNRKPTSNRIVLATYNMERVAKSLDDSSYLPSLESIQFGKRENSTKLLVHIRLRALEAGRFLKINICEIAYILKKLKEGKNAVGFDKIEITVSAFSVQIRERFNCFLKAEIDKLDPQTLTIMVNNFMLDELCRLLEEKRDGMETITKIEGIENVYKAMKKTNEMSAKSATKASNEESDKNAPIRYTDEILRMFEKVIAEYRHLDTIHRERSTQSEEEKKCEKKIDQLLGELVEKLKALNKKVKEK